MRSNVRCKRSRSYHQLCRKWWHQHRSRRILWLNLRMAACRKALLNTKTIVRIIQMIWQVLGLTRLQIWKEWSHQKVQANSDCKPQRSLELPSTATMKIIWVRKTRRLTHLRKPLSATRLTLTRSRNFKKSMVEVAPEFSTTHLRESKTGLNLKFMHHLRDIAQRIPSRAWPLCLSERKVRD